MLGNINVGQAAVAALVAMFATIAVLEISRYLMRSFGRKTQVLILVALFAAVVVFWVLFR